MGRPEVVRFAPVVPRSAGWLDYPDVASAIGVSVRTLQRWIAAGSVRSPEYNGSLARFPLDYVETFQREGLCLPGTYTRAPSVRAAAKARELKRVPNKRNTGGKPKGKPKGKSKTRVVHYGKGGAK